VTRLWEDTRGFIWAETYDGYYHFFCPETEVFTTIPDYKSNFARNFRLNSFLQYSPDTIFLGSTNGGVFVLSYNNKSNTYLIKEYPDKGNQALSNNSIRFIHADRNRDVWIGTAKGINYVSSVDLRSKNFTFQHQMVNSSFTSVCEDHDEIWFGTEESGIRVYNLRNRKFSSISRKNRPDLPSDEIVMLAYTKSGFHIAGFTGGNVIAAKNSQSAFIKIPFHGRQLNGVYEDRSSQLWLTALEFGVTRYDVKSGISRYYKLTPEAMKHLTDLERPQFYEDRRDNLWIGLHGGGLALYNRDKDEFQFFRNNPSDPNSISSNIVHSIAEDKTGQIWLGTGQFLGGIERVIMENPAFRHILPEDTKNDMLDNVVRAIMEDRNGVLWVATKAGRLNLYDRLLKKMITMDSLRGIGGESVRNNTYALYNDKEGYVWIGTKGDGLSVSTRPLDRNTDYRSLGFRRYAFIENDSSSPGSNNIYSICGDSLNNIWIGTYGNGLNVIRNPKKLPFVFQRINQQNSNLSSNLVRNILTDHLGNLWIATTQGLNVLDRERIEKGNFHFDTYFNDPENLNSISYNDIVHLFEDSKGGIWLGTFGSGADRVVRNKDGKLNITHFNTENGLSNDVIFGILEDNEGFIWLSTENGINRLDPKSNKVVIYNSYNGLTFNNFSENTCFRKSDKTLCFGGFRGIELIYPQNLLPETIVPSIELTGFMLFNKEVSVNQTGSPLTRNISFTGSVILKYNQSSFSIDYSALEFLDPGKVNYEYKLENFESEWNSVGNQHRATYTNIPPGHYVFKVRVLTNHESGVPVEKILRIRIRPPWWKTMYAFISYFILLVFTGITVYKTLSRLNRYRNELLVEKKVNELKLTFFTNVSHEIRTPLTLIISPIEDMLASNQIKGHDRALMEIIHRNARRMLHLTSQLLDFRKIQNNKMVLKIRQLDLIPFARQIFESFIPLAEHKGIRYTFETVTESLPVHADPSRLDIIIYNIISNAIKFTEEGKAVRVKIGVSVDQFIDIEVADEGPGIPQKNLADIFTRFTILSNRDYAGTGIGLSLSRELAKLHNGDILVTSEEGKGSVFTIRLPLISPEYGKDTVIESPREEDFVIDPVLMTENGNSGEDFPLADSNNASQVLLVVEDNAEILEYISAAFRSKYKCAGAQNGYEGLRIAQKLNPDLIITDIMMPGMDGLEMTKQLKQNFDTSHIPVIMLTSKVEMNEQITGIETGAEAYILKPFNMEYLKVVVNNILSQRSKIMARVAGKSDIIIDPVKITSKDEEFLQKAITFVEENFENDFSIDLLAEYCCVGRTVMYNKLKGLTGNSPLEFVRKVKMRIASQLIDKGYNVSEAAYKTGFSDVKYFSKQFKAQFGYSPSQRRLRV
jgi:signal transduction histidine kinase/ligand-binding sensor domain-containing protein/DNA-binding NarL/FixJ family response regulator